MKHSLFWRFGLIAAIGVVALFYLLNQLTIRTEIGMSHISQENRETLRQWGREAETLFNSGDAQALNNWLSELKVKENTWMTVASYEIKALAGDKLREAYFKGHILGRDVDWKIHLYFPDNPVMEIPFPDQQVSFLIQLPDRMRPGAYWSYAKVSMQIIIPSVLLILLFYLFYLYIVKPLTHLKTATNRFSRGEFDVKAKKLMGGRKDEFSELADTFDAMANRIGEQIISQRQLIADLSHELRTPLTRLDIALDAEGKREQKSENLIRIERESKHIRKLVEDTLTLAWLENEQPELQQESVELVDLLDVIIDDARFEYSDRMIEFTSPDSAIVLNSSHRVIGQALENILRNALRYTPVGEAVSVILKESETSYHVTILDKGPGVPEQYLKEIFKPFFRVDKSRVGNKQNFGLGLALAQRQLNAVRAVIDAKNIEHGGLSMSVTIPKL